MGKGIGLDDGAAMGYTLTEEDIVVDTAKGEEVVTATSEGAKSTADIDDRLKVLGINFVSLANVPKEQLVISWVWESLIPAGMITLMPADTKTGKTTLITHLIKALTSGGGMLLDRRVTPGKVVVFTEESGGEALWDGRCVELGIDRDRLVIIPNVWCGKPPLEQWQELCQLIARRQSADPYSLVIIDTAGEFLPYDNENDAMDVKRAASPLKYLTDAGMAVVILHHVGKTTGRSRGSSALEGLADVIAVLTGTDDEPRRLKTRLRYGLGSPIEVWYTIEEGAIVTLAKEEKKKKKKEGLGRGAVKTLNHMRAMEAEGVPLVLRSIRTRTGDNADDALKYLLELLRFGMIREVNKEPITYVLTDTGRGQDVGGGG